MTSVGKQMENLLIIAEGAQIRVEADVSDEERMAKFLGIWIMISVWRQWVFIEGSFQVTTTEKLPLGIAVTTTDTDCFGKGRRVYGLQCSDILLASHFENGLPNRRSAGPFFVGLHVALLFLFFIFYFLVRQIIVIFLCKVFLFFFIFFDF